MASIDDYILVGHTPVPESDRLKWKKWLRSADREVALDFISAPNTDTGQIKVITSFLGIDWNLEEEGPQRLFRTNIFSSDEQDEEEYDYAAWDEAEAGHKAIVARLQAHYKKVS